MKNIIKQYLENQLNEEQSEAFTKLLIRSLVRDRHRMHYEKTLLDDWDVNRDKSEVKPRPDWKKRWLWPVVSLAAIGLLLVGLLPHVWSTAPTAGQYADQYLADNYFDNAAPRKDGNALENLNAFDRAYYEQNYTEVQRLGEGMISQDTAQTRELFFTALSYLHRDQASRAAEILQDARESNPNATNNWREEINWFLALALIQSQQESTAREVLQSIEAGEWNYQRAQELLGYLPNLE